MEVGLLTSQHFYFPGKDENRSRPQRLGLGESLIQPSISTLTDRKQNSQVCRVEHSVSTSEIPTEFSLLYL